MMNSKILRSGLFVILTIVFALGLSGFVSANAPKLEIGVVVADFSRDFQARIMVGMQQTAAQFPNVRLDIQDGKSDPAVQTNAIETFIAQGKDLIIFTPAYVDALVPIAQKCNAAGIPLIIVNRALGEGAEFLTYVGSDDYIAGRKQGEMVRDMLGEKGNIVLLQGTLGSAPQIMREKGLVDYLAENAPGIKIIAKQNNDWDVAKTITIMQNFLTRYPKGQIDGVVVQGPYDSIAAAETAVNAGRDDLKGRVIGFDLPQEVIDAINSNLLYGAVMQDPLEQGRLAVEIGYGYLTGELKKEDIQSQTITDLPMVNQENVMNYKAAW